MAARIESGAGRYSAEEWRTRVDLAEIVAGAPRMARAVTQGQGAQLVWPGLLRRLDRQLPGYDA